MPFADEMISPRTAQELAEAIAAAAPGAALPSLRAAPGSLDPLSLRERSDLLRDALLEDLPGSSADLATVVRRARDAGALRGWMLWPVTTAVAERAIARDGDRPAAEEQEPGAVEDALALLAELTGLLTAEFALRPLLIHAPERTLAAALVWTDHPDEHVRRLASEGTRPYLPWAVRVPSLLARPEATLPILDRLYRDPSEYVRRSVANHLNDLSREHGDLVIATAGHWLDAPDEYTERLVRHALRTLVKRGDASALALRGYGDPGEALEISGPHLDREQLAIGEELELTAELRNTSAQELRLVVDYVVHHRKASGALTAKTFSLTTLTLGPGETRRLRRRHSFRPLTTRRYHAGGHALGLQVNGRPTATVPFELMAAPGPAAP